MENRRMPCRARNVSNNHNAETAFFEIPPDAEHGRVLVCSHLQCARSGRRFRFCKFCDLPATKRNFLQRHSHGQTQPLKDENSKRSNNEDEDYDSSESSGKKRARADDKSFTRAQFDYDEKQNPPYDHGDNTDNDDCALKIRTERSSSDHIQPMGTFDTSIPSPPPIRSKNHHFGPILCREIRSPTSQRKAVGTPQGNKKKDPNMDPRTSWEEAVPPSVTPSPVAGRTTRAQSHPNSRHQSFDLPQKNHLVFRRKLVPAFPEREPRHSDHRSERTIFLDQESLHGERTSERDSGSTTSFELDNSPQRNRHSVEPEMKVRGLTPRDYHWLSLLHSRPPTSDVESMRRWMDNVLHISAVHSEVTSTHTNHQGMASKHHQDMRVKSPPPTNTNHKNQNDFKMQEVSQTPPPSTPSFHHHRNSSNLSTGSQDISPIPGPRRHHPYPESNFHLSSSSRSRDSLYPFVTNENDDHPETYWRMM